LVIDENNAGHHHSLGFSPRFDKPSFDKQLIDSFAFHAA
jgi:hypothetical protein